MTDDVQAVKNLIYSYAEFLDTGDFNAMGELFSHAAIRMPGSDYVLRGQDAARNLIAGTVQLYDGIPQTKHVVTNVIVEIDADRHGASARSYYTALQVVSPSTLSPILAGRWHDRFERVDDTWRLADRTIFNDLIGDVSRHLKGMGDKP